MGLIVSDVLSLKLLHVRALVVGLIVPDVLSLKPLHVRACCGFDSS